MEYKSSEHGYCPHERQTKIICPNCGGDEFIAPYQSIVIGAPVWCYEYDCRKCGWKIGIEVYRSKFQD